MAQLVLWLYMANLMLLIMHEMDSAYQEEWKLFKIKGGINSFLILHIPMILPLLYGLAELSNGTQTGFVFSLVVSSVGVAAMIIHSTFWRLGHPEFRSWLSKTILITIMIGSVVQGALTIWLMNQ